MQQLPSEEGRAQPTSTDGTRTHPHTQIMKMQAQSMTCILTHNVERHRAAWGIGRESGRYVAEKVPTDNTDSCGQRGFRGGILRWQGHVQPHMETVCIQSCHPLTHRSNLQYFQPKRQGNVCQTKCPLYQPRANVLHATGCFDCTSCRPRPTPPDPAMPRVARRGVGEKKEMPLPKVRTCKCTSMPSRSRFCFSLLLPPIFAPRSYCSSASLSMRLVAYIAGVEACYTSSQCPSRGLLHC